MEESPWGPAMKLYSFKRGGDDEEFEEEQSELDKMLGELIGVDEEGPEPGIDVYCHKCGIQGKVTATGSITATPLSGLTRGTISIEGNMYAGAYLGINAFAQWEKTIKKPLLVKGLPGWEIPKIISLGPRLILEAMATINIEAQGQIYTGASLTWPKFEATLDFVDKSKSTKSGWTPIVDKAFEIHGSLEATAALGLPVTVNFGIDILSGRWSKGVNLTDIPAVTAHAELTIDYDLEGGLVVGNEDCAGIDWDIKLTNEVSNLFTHISGYLANVSLRFVLTSLTLVVFLLHNGPALRLQADASQSHNHLQRFRRQPQLLRPRQRRQRQQRQQLLLRRELRPRLPQLLRQLLPKVL